VSKSNKQSKTGIPGLDEILHGGLIAERLYLIDGDPGAGKTTLALQFLLEGARSGENCVYITLSETREELEAGARSHGWILDGIEIIELITDERELQNDEQLTMLPPAEVELGITTRKIIEAIERIAPHRLVLDSLSEMRLLAQSSLRYRRQILALKQFFIGRRCTVVMLDDRTAEGPDLQLHSIAHGVIALDSKAPAYGQVNREVHVVKFRGSDFVSGFHDFVIRRGGIQVFPRLVSAQHGGTYKRELIASGVASLDTLLGGGVDCGTSTLLIGPPGSGKSTVALQYAISAGKRGEKTAAFVFDETKAAIIARLGGLGMQFKEGSGDGELNLQQIDPAAISPGEFSHLVRTAVDNGARVVVIDSLNGYLNTMPQTNFLTAQLHELLMYLNNHGVATFLVVAQTGMLGSNMVSPVDASYLADSVVLFRYFEHVGKVKKAVSVAKKRTGPHEDSIRELSFDEHGLHLSEPLANLRGVLTGVPIEVSQSRDKPASDGQSDDAQYEVDRSKIGRVSGSLTLP
jgi:circadian clock protein KaiC